VGISSVNSRDLNVIFDGNNINNQLLSLGFGGESTSPVPINRPEGVEVGCRRAAFGCLHRP
jgi:hypothetical protein